MPILAKKNFIFPDEAHFDLGEYVNKQSCRIWSTENPHAFFEKPTQLKRVTIWCGFWHNWAIFLRKWARRGRYSQWRFIEPGWTNFCLQKLKRRILTTFSFHKTALRETHPKLHSMFCVLFLKIALSASELMSFDHLGAVIWHRWTIICGDKCYADKPEIIDALKDNIREAIGEIQLYTIDDVL